MSEYNPVSFLFIDGRVVAHGLSYEEYADIVFNALGTGEVYIEMSPDWGRDRLDKEAFLDDLAANFHAGYTCPSGGHVYASFDSKEGHDVVVLSSAWYDFELDGFWDDIEGVDNAEAMQGFYAYLDEHGLEIPEG